MLFLSFLLSASTSEFNANFYITPMPQPTPVGCSSQAEPDFRNFDYTLGPLDRRAEQASLRNGHYDSMAFDPPEADWRTTIERLQSLIVRGKHTWLVVLKRDHLLGTGLFRHAFVFQCQRGRLVRLFQVGGEGLYDAHVRNTEFSFVQAIWSDSDAHASPSLRRIFTYQWNAQAGRFELSGKPRLRPVSQLRP